MRERGNGEPEEEVDDAEHVVADAAVAERGEHGGELAAGLLLVVQRVEHGEADGVLFGGLGVRRGEKKDVGVLDESHELFELVRVVVAAGQALLQGGDRGEAVLLHDAAQLRRQRDVPLRRELQQLVVLELLHERRHIVL